DEVAGEEKQTETEHVYSDVPEEHQRTPERGVHDENGTPDAFSQLHTCPHCSRGYKRHTSLKDHIKLRHEKSEDNYCCSLCSYTFTYRTQLVRHMTAHRHVREQVQRCGNRKFKCTECSKAFKYKHHLKEHLRIHSGEKPYECSNCQKRFSHSGSYSSHISSKKCASVTPAVNGLPRTPGVKTALTVSRPTHILLREKVDITNKPLQEQLPLKQIKQEPVEQQPKPAPAMPTIAATTTNGVVAPQGIIQTLVLPTVGLVQPISINLSDLQNALNAAMDGNVIRQVLTSTNANGTSAKIVGQVPAQAQAVVLQPQPQVISAISLPVVGQDGNAKIIINYNPQLDSQLKAVKVKTTQPTATQTGITQAKSTVSNVAQPNVVQLQSVQSNSTETQTSGTPKPTQVNIIKPVQTGNLSKPAGVACGDNFHNYATCLLCDSSLGKRKPSDGQDSDAKGSPTTISLSSLLDKDKSGAAERLLPLLKAYSRNPEPSEEQLSQVAKTARLPLEAVNKWYQKMRSKRILLQAKTTLSAVPEGMNSTQATCTPTQPLDGTSADTQNGSAASPASPPASVSTDDLVIVKTEDVEEELQCEPLDLSLPKSSPTQASTTAKLPVSTQKEPLNLTCLKKQPLPGNTIYVTQAGTDPLNIVTAPLPTLVAIAEPGGVPCIGTAISGNKRTIFIPQLTYTYTTNPSTHSFHLTLHQKVADTASDCVSEDQNDEDSPLMKKKRKTVGGLYACDLCDKIFQKSSSLLRHKYEHTGKRPHECAICNKAFKHKHHLIEHTRLHSGEKPYQCDKCGKRFSHSGSYSQHMNHRYSYCKRDTHELPEQVSTSTPPTQLDSDERESDGEEEEDLTALDMSDIRVVRVGEEYEDDEESCGEEEQDRGREEQETEEGGMVMEVELGDTDTLEEETVETEDAMESKEEDTVLTNNEENTEMATED
uniref:Zinc finger E-box-binding homeobox 1-like n=1 Tax=Sinocyclocheilus rhinocerous TaxID=307959 RepID=A0A673MTE9_9TELE